MPSLFQSADEPELFRRALGELMETRIYNDEEFRVPRLILSLNHQGLKDLKLQPGDQHFVTWFVVATYIPVLVACMGPVSSMTSIAALVLSWRRDPLTGLNERDRHWMLVLNAVSLAMGFAANLALLLNFSQRLDYKRAQCLSILGWFVGGVLLITDLALTTRRSFVHGDLVPTESFWYAVLTACINLCSMALLALNFLGYLLGRYTASFNLDAYQRSLMFQTMLLSVWLSAGAGFLSHLLEVPYGVGLYYCTVTVLTIGLGDVLPPTNVARGLTLVFALVGLLVLALIVTTMRDIILSDHLPTMLWNHIERSRRGAYRTHRPAANEEEAFDIMAEIRKEKLKTQRYLLLAITLAIFVTFWMLGAVVFHRVEGWKFFDAVYFCFLCLLTIGYGDFAPKTDAGRPLFVVWALSAVPLMTMLISNMGDTLIGSLGRFIERFQSLSRVPELFGLVRVPVVTREPSAHTLQEDRARVDAGLVRAIQHLSVGLGVEPMPEDLEECFASISVFEGFLKDLAPNYSPHPGDRVDTNNDLVEVVRIVYHIRKLLVCLSADDAPEAFLFEEWNTLLLLNPPLRESLSGSDPAFWLSPQSPLKYPLKEVQYFIYQYLEALQQRLNRIVKKRLVTGRGPRRSTSERSSASSGVAREK